MNAQEAAQKAKEHVDTVFAAENFFNLGLEEIEFDEATDTWNVTVAFSRPWNSLKTSLSAITGEPQAKRAYKIVKMRSSDGELISIKRRDLLD